ncbi:MAG: LysR family transcriptional regulator [Gammaproteobacteria bacterium]
MTTELNHLRQVVALAEHGSFVRAAAALHISQPALSRSIQGLERRFGSPLFLRWSGGVVPTDLGRVYVERARDLLRMADELDREAVSAGALRSAVVTLGAGAYAATAVARAASKFILKFPGVGLRIVTRNWDELLRLLRSRELEFFVAETSTLRGDPELDIVSFPEAHPMYFVARPGHPLAGRSHVALPDVFHWPVVTPGRIPPRLMEPLLAAQGEASARGERVYAVPWVECNELLTAKRIVMSSDAITAAILPGISAELEAGRLVLVSPEPWSYSQYGIVTLAGRRYTHAAEQFLAEVLETEQEFVREEGELIARYARAP